MRKYIILCIVFAFIIPYAVAEYEVCVVYFVPKDRMQQADLPTNLATQMQQVQTFFADEMERHGFERKTFELEMDTDSNVVVHSVVGQQNDAQYHTDTLNKIDAETNQLFDNTDICVIVVDVSTDRIDGNCGIARYDGGPVMIPASGDCVVGDHSIQLIAHELGHALNLVHDWRDNTYIMSYGAHRNKLSACAAMLLNVSPYFNDNVETNTDSTITMLTPNKYLLNADGVDMRFEISDPDGIYQVQMEHAAIGDNAGLYDCACVPGKQNAVVKFEMPEGATQSQQNSVWIRVVDMNGRVKTTEHILHATEGIEADIEWTYLTLGYDSPDALMPINPSAEWVLNWNRIQNTWEKHPNVDIPDRPDRNFSDVNNIPFADKWEHWIYAHAQSRLVYNLTNVEHRQFVGYLYLPNPCGNVASIAMICSADNDIIYRSGTIKTAQAQNKQIRFEVPTNANRLIIQITDAGDGNVCDHYILANARLQQVTQSTIDENETDNNESPRAVMPIDKMTTTWAEIKNAR